MGTSPGIVHDKFGYPIRTRLEFHKVGLRWVGSLQDTMGNQIWSRRGFKTKSEAWDAGMIAKNAARAKRMSDGV